MLRSIRIKGVTRHKTLLNLGQYFCIPKEDWKELIRHVEDRLKGLAPLPFGHAYGIGANHFGQLYTETQIAYFRRQIRGRFFGCLHSFTAVSWGLPSPIIHAQITNPSDKEEMSKIVYRREHVRVAPIITLSFRAVFRGISALNFPRGLHSQGIPISINVVLGNSRFLEYIHDPLHFQSPFVV